MRREEEQRFRMQEIFVASVMVASFLLAATVKPSTAIRNKNKIDGRICIVELDDIVKLIWSAGQ